MSSSNSTLVIGILVIMGVGGLVTYSNVNNQLVSTQAQLQQVQKERDELKKQSEDKDREIKDLQKTVSGGKEEISRQLEEIERAKTETQTVSSCLGGVVEALSYQDDQAKAIFALGAVKDKCESAQKIIQRIENTRDQQPTSTRTSTVVD